MLCLPLSLPLGEKVTLFCYTVFQVTFALYKQTLYACLSPLSLVQKLPFSAILCLRFLWQDTSKLCMPASQPCPWCKSYHFLLYCVSCFLAGHQQTVPASQPCPRCKSYHFLLYCVSGFSGRTLANCASLPPCPVPGAKVTIFCYTVSHVFWQDTSKL